MEKGSLQVSNTSKSTCALPKEKGSTCARLGVCVLRLIGASERVGGCEALDASGARECVRCVVVGARECEWEQVGA